MNDKEITFAQVVIFGKDPQGYGVGVELCNFDRTPYAIMSLWLPKVEFPSQRQSLFNTFEEVFKYIPENHRHVKFRGCISWFTHRVYEMKRKAGMYADGRTTSFHYLEHKPGVAFCLAVDATSRKTTIIEEL